MASTLAATSQSQLGPSHGVWSETTSSDSTSSRVFDCDPKVFYRAQVGSEKKLLHFSLLGKYLLSCNSLVEEVSLRDVLPSLHGANVDRLEIIFGSSRQLSEERVYVTVTYRKRYK